MTPTATSFTAKELSQILRVSPAAVRQRLRGLPTFRTVVRGQEAIFWKFADLPDEIRLRVLAAKRDFRTFGDLKAHVPAPSYDSGLDPGAVSPEVLNAAIKLREALAPIMENGESFTAMAKDAAHALAKHIELALFSVRTLRRMISGIHHNDAGKAEWSNLHLYLAEAAQISGLASADSTNERKLVESADASPLFSEPAAFERACESAIEMEKTHGVKVATRKALDWLESNLENPPTTREALRARFRRVMDRYNEGLRGVDLLADTRAGNAGRKPLIELTPEEVIALRKLVVQTNSITAAFRIYASRPECRDELADAILRQRSSKHTLTRSLRDMVAVPDAIREYHKSPTRTKRERIITPRTLSYIDAAGKERPLLPGQLCERDDLSMDFIFYVDWPFGGDKCSEKHGVRIARGQNLLQIDVASLRFLSFNLLVRLRDSYRAADIWSWVGQSYRDLGIPEIGERWERGVWKAKNCLVCLCRTTASQINASVESRRWGGRSSSRRARQPKLLRTASVTCIAYALTFPARSGINVDRWRK
jgi:hypothetical protein